VRPALLSRTSTFSSLGVNLPRWRGGSRRPAAAAGIAGDGKGPLSSLSSRVIPGGPRAAPNRGPPSGMGPSGTVPTSMRSLAHSMRATVEQIVDELGLRVRRALERTPAPGRSVGDPRPRAEHLQPELHGFSGFPQLVGDHARNSSLAWLALFCHDAGRLYPLQELFRRSAARLRSVVSVHQPHVAHHRVAPVAHRSGLRRHHLVSPPAGRSRYSDEKSHWSLIAFAQWRRLVAVVIVTASTQPAPVARPGDSRDGAPLSFTYT